MKSCVTLAAVVVLAAGCKGKVEYKDSQETLDKLSTLEGQVKDKDAYIQKLRDQNAEYERGGGTASGSDEWTFTIEGDALTLTGKPTHGGGSGGPSISDAAATANANQFLEMVQKSKGPIEKCYELALKKSNALATRTVDLKVVASFSSAGAFRQVSFSPDLPQGFDGCLREVASKWKMPAGGSGTYQASVKLTPT